MPWSATRSFPHPLTNLSPEGTKSPFANFISYTVVEVIMWEGLGDLINAFRQKELGLKPLDGTQAPNMVHNLGIPFTYLW